MIEGKEIGAPGSGVFVCTWRHWREISDEGLFLRVAPDVLRGRVCSDRSSTAMSYVVDHLVGVGAVLMTGVQGCGKTSTCLHILQNMQSKAAHDSKYGNTSGCCR